MLTLQRTRPMQGASGLFRCRWEGALCSLQLATMARALITTFQLGGCTCHTGLSNSCQLWRGVLRSLWISFVAVARGVSFQEITDWVCEQPRRGIYIMCRKTNARAKALLQVWQMNGFSRVSIGRKSVKIKGRYMYNNETNEIDNAYRLLSTSSTREEYLSKRTWLNDQLCCSSVCKHCRRRDWSCHSQVLDSSRGIRSPPLLPASEQPCF